jgi:hypothetical protein
MPCPPCAAAAAAAAACAPSFAIQAHRRCQPACSATFQGSASFEIARGVCIQARSLGDSGQAPRQHIPPRCRAGPGQISACSSVAGGHAGCVQRSAELVTAAVNGGDAVERMREVLQVVDTDTLLAMQAAALEQSSSEWRASQMQA